MALKQSTRRLSINLDHDLHRAFKLVAAAEGREMTEIVLEFVREYVGRRQASVSESIQKALAGDRSKTKA
jgi:hypothetical protein